MQLLALLARVPGVLQPVVGRATPQQQSGAQHEAGEADAGGLSSRRGESVALALDVVGWRAVERVRGLPPGAAGLLPEQRLRFVFDNAGSVAVVWDGQQQPGIEHSSGGGVGPDEQEQAGSIDPEAGGCGSRAGPLPQWLGLQGAVPVVSAAAAAHILEEQVFFEPFARVDAWRLLEQGCCVQVGACAGGVGGWQRTAGEPPAARCTRSTLDLRPYPTACAHQELLDATRGGDAAAAAALPPGAPCRLVTFPSLREALARGLLLAALTWDARGRSCALLRPPPLAAAVLARQAGELGAGAAAGGPPADADAAGAAGRHASVLSQAAAADQHQAGPGADDSSSAQLAEGRAEGEAKPGGRRQHSSSMRVRGAAACSDDGPAPRQQEHPGGGADQQRPGARSFAGRPALPAADPPAAAPLAGRMGPQRPLPPPLWAPLGGERPHWPSSSGPATIRSPGREARACARGGDAAVGPLAGGGMTPRAQAPLEQAVSARHQQVGGPRVTRLQAGKAATPLGPGRSQAPHPLRPPGRRGARCARRRRSRAARRGQGRAGDGARQGGGAQGGLGGRLQPATAGHAAGGAPAQRTTGQQGGEPAGGRWAGAGGAR
jgi:hypothetical protein